MSDLKSNSHPRQLLAHWVPVRDEHGRTRLEARWTSEPAVARRRPAA